mmetsp:Transcript_17869/g.19900  ORF Transcript_17869/g.19900 Transcript_17869/m.19900 type:complete len:142 (+) Transcript_17869:92-517(+)
MATEDTIFTRIVKGSIPCYKVYETTNVLAFLDINPVNKGHTLVISKQPYPDLMSIPDDILAEVAVATKKVAIAVKKATNADGVNIVQNNCAAAGQVVFHYHAHVIPRFEKDGLRFFQPKEAKSYQHDEGTKQAKDIADAIV